MLQIIVSTVDVELKRVNLYIQISILGGNYSLNESLLTQFRSESTEGIS